MIKKSYETERKFILEQAPESLSHAKWFFIVQWYKKIGINCEEKIKLLIDSSGFTCDIVNVKKNRIDNTTSEKTVQYLQEKDLHSDNIHNLPHIVKRRAVLGKVSIDHFIHCKKQSLIIMEVDDGYDYKAFSSLIVKEVTNDINYRNSMLAMKSPDISQYIPVQLISLLPFRTNR